MCPQEQQQAQQQQQQQKAYAGKNRTFLENFKIGNVF
jgi:hypothetical protein